MNVARFKVEFYDKTAEKEYLSLDGSVRAMVDKGIARLALRADEIGKPLSGLLAGCRELKFRTDGIRVIYRIRDGARRSSSNHRNWCKGQGQSFRPGI